MAVNQSVNFKKPLRIISWLDTALEKEKEKYKKCPIIPDLVSGHEVVQGWGYVIAGYFLIEQSFKALLYFREKEVPTKHSLSTLFNLFDPNDQSILREYYTDYQATIGGSLGEFPFKSLDDFILNLDGDKNKRGNNIGSFDWRYFLIEEQKSNTMPIVSVDYLHEIAYGCIQIAEYAHNGRSEPSRYTHSWRRRWKREMKYRDWLNIRMNSNGWDDLGDRLEILWGPDYRGRYDFYLFRGKRATDYFSEIPSDLELPVVDKREEIETFDVEAGYRSIGVTHTSRPPKNW